MLSVQPADQSDNDEVRRIKKDIRKSGFPLEIEVSSMLERDTWNVILHDYYLDEEEEKRREIDVAAHKGFPIGDDRWIRVHLIFECKKSDKPWVFYTTDKGNLYDLHQNVIKSFHTPGFYKNGQTPETWMKESHYFSQSIDRTLNKNAVIDYEPFTNGKGRRIFEASMKVIGAITFDMKRSYKMARAQVRNTLLLWYPTIVFDGHLFEYTLKEEVKSVPYTQYLVNYRFADRLTTTLVGDLFLIDVVRKDYLPELLNVVRQELKGIENKLVLPTDR